MSMTEPTVKDCLREIETLKSAINRLERELDFFKRENNRRKLEINQVASVLRKG